MSYDGINERDLPLKLRMMHLLWHLGWFVRPNVKLQMYYEGTRTPELFTDLDVIAVFIRPLDDPLRVICSAKSGKESDSAQIFWLAGLKSYFGADTAYYVRSKADLRKARILCDRLKIIPLNEEQLKAIESRIFPSKYETLFMFTEEAYKKVNLYFEELKKAKKELHGYVTERYWIDDKNLQLMRIVTGIRELSKLPLTDEARLFLKYYMASLLALPILHITQRFATTPHSLFKGELDTMLKGGEIARTEKEKMIREVKGLLQEFLKHTNLSNDMLYKGVDLDKMFRLDYFDELLELLSRLVENYSKSIHVPRMMDVLAFEILRTNNLASAFQNASLPGLAEEERDFALKLARDVLIFLLRIEAFTKSDIP